MSPLTFAGHQQMMPQHPAITQIMQSLPSPMMDHTSSQVGMWPVGPSTVATSGWIPRPNLGAGLTSQSQLHPPPVLPHMLPDVVQAPPSMGHRPIGPG